MKFQPPAIIRIHFIPAILCGVSALSMILIAAHADEMPQKLPFVQDWSDAALITQENDWSGVPGFVGYRGDKLASKPGANPQAITAAGNSSPVNVLANQKNPNTQRTGGVAEFDTIANPCVALKGSGTAVAPMLVLNLDTRGKQNIAVGYKLRDLDGSVNNAVQPVALQYRAGTNSPFVDVPAVFAPDATTGPGVATLVTPIVAVLPAAANNQAQLQVRWITANAEGNDEWVGIDEIAVIGDDLATAPPEDDWQAEASKPFKPVRAAK